ncbi:MAG: hypothetical protein WCG27_11245 [Pseudomonadota bacterium]
MKKLIAFSLGILLLSGCASNWKVHGGPDSCKKMCQEWDLEFTAMVGVGNQDKTGEGATACVCQPKSLIKTSAIPGGASSATSIAAPIVAAAQAAAAAAAAQTQRNAQAAAMAH